ncbi:hypothetical protein B0H17DRAFT_1142748, partial [Mycena rosella]
MADLGQGPVERSTTVGSLGQMASSTRGPDFAQCECSRCGAGSDPVSRSTRRQHTEEDRERKLKRTQPSPGPSVSARDFMAKRKKASRADPPASENSDAIGSFADLPTHLPPIENAELGLHPPSLESPDDVTMTDFFILPAVVDRMAESSSRIPSPTILEHPMEVDLSPELSTHLLEPRHSLAEESTFWFWQLILITTAWLHLHFHTPHRACTLLLKVLRHIF